MANPVLRINLGVALTVCLLQSAQSTAAEVGDDLPGDSLGEVVVTAERRPEKLQSVPIAITAVTAEQLASSSIRDTETLSAAVPGLTFTKFAIQASPAIRGLGSNNITQGDENTVATYVDGILQQSPNNALLTLAGIERIEVLKGPQGTLFGRNADAGVINITTRAPTAEKVLEVSAGYGNLRTVDASLYASTGVIDGLATNLVVSYHDQFEGYVHDFFTDSDIYKSYDLTVRNKWLWTPSDDTSITFTAAYNSDSDDGACARLIPGQLGADGVTTYAGYYTNQGNQRCLDERRGFDFALVASHDFNFATFTSLTGYSWLKSRKTIDADYSPAPIFEAPYSDNMGMGITQEMNLQSRAESPIKWIGGLYFLNSKAGQNPPNGLTIVGSALGVPFFRVLGYEGEKSYAGYAQATATVLPATRLTVGMRYTSDQRTIDAITEIPNLVTSRGDTSARFNKFNYKVTLDHNLAEHVLVYATVSTGFKAGLYNLTQPGAPPARPENLTMYELGWKSEFFGRKLQINGAGYYYNYKDIQETAAPNGSLSSLINAAEAKVKGVDFDFQAILYRGLRLRGGAAFNNSRFSSFPGAIENVPAPGGGAQTAVIDATGNTLPRAPKVSYSIGPMYTFNTAAGRFDLSTLFSHQSEFFWDYAEAFREGSHDLLSASVVWAPRDNFEARFWGFNLLDKEYANSGLNTSKGDIVTPAAPRTYGVSFRVTL